MRMPHLYRRVHARRASSQFAAAGGMRAVDCSGVLSSAGCNWLKANGYSAAIRYLGRMSAGEANTIRASGLDVIGVLEHNGNGGYSGYSYGAQCMQDAINGTRAAGGPQSGIVLWIAEFDFDASNPAAAQPFIDGAHDRAHANGYLSGMYGPWGLGARTHNWDGWWQTMSTGFFGNAYTTACTMSQHFPYVYAGGVQCDQDDIHDPTHAGLWHGSAPTPPPAPVQEDDMVFETHLDPGEMDTLPLPVMVGAQLSFTVDFGSHYVSGDRAPGAVIRAIAGGPWWGDTAASGDNGWAPVFGHPTDAKFGPDAAVTWLSNGTQYRHSNGKGGMLVVENLDAAGVTRLGGDGNAFGYGNRLHVAVSYKAP